MEQGFSYFLEQFADLRILKYKVPGFENLSLKQKKLVYFLSQAAICGRDILYDQNGKYNLLARKSLENIYKTYSLERKGKEWDEFVIYLKRVWFSNGLHHHYSNDKFIPNFTQQYFKFLCSNSGLEKFLTDKELSFTDTIKLLENLIFNKDFYAQKIVSETQKDIVKESAVNFYGETVTQKTAEEYYSNIRSRNDSKPVSHGLNSMLDYEQGKLIERTWKLGGMYSSAIEKICSWLVKAVDVAENEEQKEGIRKLIEYYETGDLKAWDEYNILWVKDLKSHIDFINGFIEVYSDPLGMKGTWESIVNFKDIEATRRTIIISENAQWFEDNSPVHNRFKKEKVKGVSAKVITVAMLGGDCYPATPIGINLPNADWIRKEYGSKSVTIDNITYAYAQADLKSGFLEEFSFSEEDIELEKKYGYLTDSLHTDLHECLGHGSGKLMPGVSSEDLKNYHSPIEETRADLFALYFILDPKLVELGLLPNLKAGEVQYQRYIRNGLMTQLRRIEPGKNIEQAHMRNRQLISKWCFEKGKDENVIEIKKIKNKSYIKINDYNKLRGLFGELLREIQRIKSEGDFEEAKRLVENYGVLVDVELHKEVLERVEKLNLPAYSGFVNPTYIPEIADNEIVDVKVTYSEGYADQMIRYSEDFSFL